MSYTLTPILVDLPTIRALMGSKDTALLQAVIKKYRRDLVETDGLGDYFEEFKREIKAEYKAFVAGDFSAVDLTRVYPAGPKGDPFRLVENDEADDEDAAPVRETTAGGALAHLILGGNTDPSVGYKYGYALLHLCDHLGTIPDHDSWCAIRWTSVEAVDAVLQTPGVKPKTFSVRGHLQERGAPITMPAPDDFPAIGYLTRAEAGKLLAALDPAKLAAAIRKADKSSRDWLTAATGELRSWLEACVDTDRDLICFYH